VNEKTCGIYKIKNIITGQKYIGQSIDIETRWKQHCDGKAIKNSYIDRAINKYGEDNFELIIIEETPIHLLNEREKYWIEYYCTYTNIKHYNLTPGGDSYPKDLNIKHKISKAKNTSGYFRVYKHYDNNIKQGFRWAYQYHDKNGKRKGITSTDIKKLEKKVKEKGLPWIEYQ
jgi:group I intron endonuclease